MRGGRWFQAITTPRDAPTARRACALTFATLGVFQAFLGVFVSLEEVLFAGIWVALALLMQMTQNRWVTLVPLFAACLSLANTLARRSDGITGSTNVGLMFVVLWFTIRAVQAAFAQHHLATRDTALFQLAAVSDEHCPRCGVGGAELGVITGKWRCKACGTWFGTPPQGHAC
jgi:uncharacterized protein (DUF983 family)